MRFRWKRLFSIKVLGLVAGLSLVLLLLPNQPAVDSAVPQFEGKRALLYSPFHRLGSSLNLGRTLSSILHATSKYHSIGSQWPTLSLSEKCRFYFETALEINPDWTNDHVKTFYNDNNLDDPLAELMVERIRMYDSCFISGQLSTSKVFKGSNVKPMDLESRLFPFLSKETPFRKMWPNIIHANDWTLIPPFSNPLLEGRDTWKMDDNYSFFYNWNNFAEGKGIALTLGLRHGDQFKQLLLTLENLNNTLPIQVVHNGSELTESFILDIHSFLNLKKLSQQVYFVNIEPLINKAFVEDYVHYFTNKWLALVFNTFSEVVIMDADVVSFVNPETFFEFSGYHDTGMLLFRDRNIVKEKTFTYCTDTLNKLYPSVEESYFMKHETTFPVEFVADDIPKGNLSVEESVYYEFFHNLQLHHVDSGLAVINRLSKLPSLLMSTMLNIDAKLQRCVYGDKEIFWLGQFVAGEQYSIYPTEGSIVGSIEPKDNEEFEICATQMAHVSTEGNLLWSNGGLRKCKIDSCAVADFDHDTDYFQSRYNNPMALQEIYDSPLSINGYITPDVKKYPWLKIKECHQYTYCATAKEDIGTIGRFDEDTVVRLQKISNIWNTDVKINDKGEL
ncbi:unnamed protein product [Kluyveromyces dobzhanskii CBS 2104]|uniref:WGS project CCBQ000000000 data, contig 00102 n=1 Tax=Kluyveromyces dobzhanskii CBS 2104 TaxID=1427455 RepID=A0A0A8L6J5_9SACH|nr:unnamed protein product [Kluyveromyces dobzhanskii CBS 2104]